MPTASDLYWICVKGHIDPRWSAWFDGLTITHEANGNTMLIGQLRDQAELYGLLFKLQRLNLALLSLHRMDFDDNPESGSVGRT